MSAGIAGSCTRTISVLSEKYDSARRSVLVVSVVSGDRMGTECYTIQQLKVATVCGKAASSRRTPNKQMQIPRRMLVASSSERKSETQEEIPQKAFARRGSAQPVKAAEYRADGPIKNIGASDTLGYKVKQIPRVVATHRQQANADSSSDAWSHPPRNDSAFKSCGRRSAGRRGRRSTGRLCRGIDERKRERFGADA